MLRLAGYSRRRRRWSKSGRSADPGGADREGKKVVVFKMCLEFGDTVRYVTAQCLGKEEKGR